MWSETVCLRTRPVLDQKSDLVLVLQVGWCVVKYGLVMLVIMILKETATFQVHCTIYTVSGEKVNPLNTLS